MLAGTVSFVLQLSCAILLMANVVAALVLWKGCRVLRLLALVSTRDDVPILLKSPRVPAVSVLAVAHDASPKSRAFARRLLDLHFGQHELVLVLEGVSTDEMAVWIEEFHLVPSYRATSGELPSTQISAAFESTDPLTMLVLKKEPAGEADSWNMGVNAATSPVIAIFDPETEFAPESLLRLIRPMLDEPELVFAVCGAAPAPPAAGLPGSFADIEATRLWLGRCAALAGSKNMLTAVPGSTILVRRDAIVPAGGFSAGPLELFLHLQGRARRAPKPYRAAYVPEAVCYLPAARTLGELRRRNLSDQRSIAKAIRHRNSIMGGWFALGWGLPAIAFYRIGRPLLETAVYALTIAGLLLGLVSPSLALLVLLTTVCAGILVSMSAVVFRELADFRGSDPSRLARLFWAAVPENVGYRQMRNLWLIGGFFGKQNAV